MLEMPELIKEWKKVSYAPLFFGYLGTALTSNAGWETGLDKVPEINGQMPLAGAVMCLDCTNTMYNISNNGLAPKCYSPGQEIFLLYILRFGPGFGHALCLILHNH